ncbi:hypothetical protein EX30DRAFT_373852 [Ascodesmis nigricans]|uniref:Uncharacterized protein n=1 Tax=Ascodesmis nigricans TaxID=341454 RepID=A0A4S2MNB6_9PEZI|nr:hypothetical protein EX30DRAFT_373852 [Ascodesmis nigricans]
MTWRYKDYTTPPRAKKNKEPSPPPDPEPTKPKIVLTALPALIAAPSSLLVVTQLAHPARPTRSRTASRTFFQSRRAVIHIRTTHLPILQRQQLHHPTEGPQQLPEALQ